MHKVLVTVNTMKGEQSDPIRAAAVDVPTAMFLSSRMKEKNIDQYSFPQFYTNTSNAATL